MPGYPLSEQLRRFPPSSWRRLAGAPINGAGRCAAVTGVTHASAPSDPATCTRRCPAPRLTAPQFAGGAGRRCGRGADRRGRRPGGRDWPGLPAIVVDDPRAPLGDVAAASTASRRGSCGIGITGTAGKTSTAYLIEAGLRAAGHVTGLIGTVETRIGD